MKGRFRPKEPKRISNFTALLETKGAHHHSHISHVRVLTIVCNPRAVSLDFPYVCTQLPQNFLYSCILPTLLFPFPSARHLATTPNRFHHRIPGPIPNPGANLIQNHLYKPFTNMTSPSFGYIKQRSDMATGASRQHCLQKVSLSNDVRYVSKLTVIIS
jgi:hypothetical protein